MAVVLTIAVAQLLLEIVGTPAALARVPWPYIVNVLSFGMGGLVFLAGGGRDRRLPLLGGLFLTVGSAFAVSLMPQSGVAVEQQLEERRQPCRQRRIGEVDHPRVLPAVPTHGTAYDGTELIPIEGATAGLPGDSVLAEFSVRPGARSSSILEHWSRLRECFPRPIGNGWTMPTRICCSRSWVRPECSWGCW